MKISELVMSGNSCKKCGSFLYKISSYMNSTNGGWKCGGCGLEQFPASPIAEKMRTQKMKGLVNLYSQFGGAVAIPVAVIQSMEDIEKDDFTDQLLSGGLYFARPCPKRPRHGFVDSRVVKSVEELRGVVKETQEADPEGEVMMMRYIPSRLNVVWTPSLLTVGKGNDGATCGKDTLMIPLSGKNPLPPSVLKKAGIGEKDWPYIEAVYREGAGSQDFQLLLTQLRAGPIGDAKPNFIPSAVKVKRVLPVDTSSSLLEWETLMGSVKGEEGLVISHRGGSPTDHFSVHARTFGIPVITSFDVKVGDELEPIPFIPPTPSSVIRGLIAAEKVALSHQDMEQTFSTNNAVKILLFALHNSGVMEGDNGMWLGLGAGLMMRLGCLALKGEARHINATGKMTRETVYRRALMFSLRRHRSALPRLIHTLRYGKFPGSSIGGIKWAQCGAATSGMFNAVADLCREPTVENVGALMRAYNTAVNQAHNGGWWLNKFADSGLFESIQNGDILAVLQAVPLLMLGKDIADGLDSTMVDRKVGIWGKWKPVSYKHVPITSAEINLTPGINGINFEVSDRRLKTHHKSFQLSIDNLYAKLPLILEGKVFIVPTDDGVKIELRRPNLDAIVLWQEDPLTPQLTKE